MNLRSVYWALLIGLSLTLLFQWTSEKREESVNDHLLKAQTYKPAEDDGYISIENDELYVVVSVATGNIVETRLKKYPVENAEGALGYRVFGESKDVAFNYYFKSGFTKTSPVYSVEEAGKDYVVLGDGELGLTKRISFSDSPYELSIYDESLVGVDGKVFAGLYRTGGRALDLKRDALDGGMMNNSSYEGVAISSEQDPYDTSRLSRGDDKKEVLTRAGCKNISLLRLLDLMNIFTTIMCYQKSLVYIEWVIRLKALLLAMLQKAMSIVYLWDQK